ncbi:MAG: selT/selW/selH-like putative selenoprotein [Candidatus Paceibacteria bacterium]
MLPDLEIELVRGSGGCFEVTVDGNLVFSKLSLDRFPAYQEVPTLLGT